VTGQKTAMDSPKVVMLQSILKNENGIMGYYLRLFLPKNIPACLSFDPLKILHIPVYSFPAIALLLFTGEIIMKKVRMNPGELIKIPHDFHAGHNGPDHRYVHILSGEINIDRGLILGHEQFFQQGKV